MKVSLRTEFSSKPEATVLAHQAIYDAGEKLLEGQEVVVKQLDDTDNVARVAALDFRVANRINRHLPAHSASLAQQRMQSIPLQREPYDRVGVASIVADKMAPPLMSKNFFQRMLRSTHTEGMHTNDRLSRNELKVSQDFTIMTKAAQLLVTNEKAQVMDVAVEQVAMEGEVEFGGTVYAFNPARIATIASFDSGQYDGPDVIHSATTEPQSIIQADKFYAPLDPLLLPGQLVAGRPLLAKDFAFVLMAIDEQQLPRI